MTIYLDEIGNPIDKHSINKIFNNLLDDGKYKFIFVS